LPKRRERGRRKKERKGK
jgi:hypothetical protein